MDALFKSSSNFASLSLKDLIEARDLFHYHLMGKKNVVGTALGLYRIRKTDPWPSKDHPAEPHIRNERRTLFNSEVRPYSWPCVYVFVSDWLVEQELAQHDPSDVVPNALFLPDGRVVPVCVIETRLQSLQQDLKIQVNNLRPRNLLGPGSAIVNSDGQGMDRLTTAGCLVRDGERYYVLTNRHGVGAPGTALEALLPHRQVAIGTTADKGLTREDFDKIYPHFKSDKQRLLMDIGLVDIYDVLQWKTDVPGISPVGPVLDLFDNSFNLKLITMKVAGYSAVTGFIRGEIHGLFYRFKAMGGSEYISDFLIGPRTASRDTRAVREPEGENVSLAVHHGDSGTVLYIEHEEETSDGDKTSSEKSKTTYYPFAILWGKEDVVEDGKAASQPFALATSLSVAMDRLNLDMVRDINLDQEYIWGWVGHYIIANALPLPTQLLGSSKLKAFITKNIDLMRVMPDDALGNDPRVLNKNHPDAPMFVPLADVPDNVWKSNVNFIYVKGPDGKSHRKYGPGSRGRNDNQNHFADMDLPYKGKDTFLKYNVANLSTALNPDVWIDYYDSVKPKYDAWAAALGKRKPVRNAHWGALPFRVWQLFDAMVEAASKGKQAEFLCAGGVLIHYLGDACQPLHTSYLSQGDPDRVVKRPRSNGKKLEADGVHQGYEDDMVEFGYLEKKLATKLESEIARQSKLTSEEIPLITSGLGAAQAVIKLIEATQKTIAPRDIVEKWVALKGTSRDDRNAAMWQAFGTRTIRCMARGSRVLAAVWGGAWKLGNGDTKIGEGAAQTQKSIMKLYDDPKVVPSVRLDHYGPILK